MPNHDDPNTIRAQQFDAARVFEGADLLQIAMPMGGIGAGCICLNGQGGLQDFAIRHHPAITAMPDGHHATESGFATLHIKGAHPITKLLEGPLPAEKVYDQGLQSQGHRKGGYEGLPRMGKCAFRAAYPFGEVMLSDRDVPLTVRLSGWSPFIPLDDRNSSIPCAILEYELRNSSASPVEYELAYHLSHLATGVDRGRWRTTRRSVIPEAGIFFSNTEGPTSEWFGSASLSVVGHCPRIKAMWLRSGWFDWMAALWREVSTSTFRENNGNSSQPLDGHNGGSILLAGRLNPGQQVTYPIVITWHFPNVMYEVGKPKPQGCAPGSGCCGEAAQPQIKWRPFYAGKWGDAAAVADYVRCNYTDLRRRTVAFRDGLFQSTLPPEVIDAVASNLAILKSPTVLRQENGNLWAWEGCFPSSGCCPGTCTHVWNYAQALPHLFPALERTLRHQELEHSMNDLGHINFRAALPDGPTEHGYHAAADGQLGGIMKLYRDWQISGDTAWMRRLYPMAKRSIEYCINKWDPDRRGALFEPHHNTYDIEFWGPDGMCTSIYLGALSAIAALAQAAGDSDESAYRDLALLGGAYCDRELFNGEYYQHKVMWRDLRDQSFVENLEKPQEADPELMRILREQGPKHQYGSGCLSDGVIGAWMARIYGIDSPMTRQNVHRTLAAVFRHNYKSDLSAHAGTQRPGYATGHEPGLILCSWPRGDQPILPFVYSDEVWTGIEYQVASHLIEEGMVEEGLTIVRGVRTRYDGRTRNPFNEYECGNYYARAMASYAVLNSISGFRYSAVSRTVWFGPKLATRPWRSFFSAASGFGEIHLDNGEVEIRMTEGELLVDQLIFTSDDGAREIVCNQAATVHEPLQLTITE